MLAALCAPAAVLAAALSPPAATTVVRLVKETITVDGATYDTLAMRGSGPQWRLFDGGVEGLYVAANETLDVTWQNDLVGDLSIVHAHGQKGLPPKMDGVPDISGPPIPPQGGQQRIQYEPSDGTYFVHSHWGLQHELGLAAPLVVADRSVPSGYPLAAELRRARDVVLWAEDFCARNEEVDVLNPSCFDAAEMYGALRGGWGEDKPTWNYSDCMEPGLDSDVQYSSALINDGTPQHPKVICADEGEVLRLRIINAAGFNQYQVRFPFNVTVVTTDSNYVHPYTTDRLWMALAQRLDVLVTVPNGVWDVEMVAQGLSLHSTIRFAPSSECAAQRVTPTPKIPMVAGEKGGYMDFWGYDMKAWYPLAPAVSIKHVYLNVTGDNGFKAFNEHSWQLRPAAIAYRAEDNTNRIDVKAGERVCVHFRNFNADAHPIHLHGHFFQVVEVDGEAVSGPLRDTFNLARGACHTATLCFDADAKHCEDGCEWPLHCHISYHLAAGMLTTVKYVV